MRMMDFVCACVLTDRQTDSAFISIDIYTMVINNCLKIYQKISHLQFSS